MVALFSDTIPGIMRFLMRKEPAMSDTNKPEQPASDEDESLDQRAARLEQQRVGAEDEVRKSPDGPSTQISPEIEPSGS
ncbi:hypothetical protein [Teichococcus vastitatis]|uniref:Uncharacterized protein n=1 Tax=Teichococcus vastitatis TaxID=2307076 RepID=A0ABS9WAJ8_9PROT|nr:hypothetical protein [Pseudoroseomonas vastitatis]MCI0756327.1 hypothetical protein [Pseudoroseomonas vastitatis]